MEYKTFYPTCRFCKQQILPMAAYPTQAAADEAATIACKCYEAKEYQEKLEKEKERDKNIKKLRQSIDDFSTYCEKRNVDLKGSLHDLLLRVGIAVLDGAIDGANIKFYRMKVNITTNSKGNIVISFTYSDGAKVEV